MEPDLGPLTYATCKRGWCSILSPLTNVMVMGEFIQLLDLLATWGAPRN